MTDKYNSLSLAFGNSEMTNFRTEALSVIVPQKSYVKGYCAYLNTYQKLSKCVYLKINKNFQLYEIFFLTTKNF